MACDLCDRADRIEAGEDVHAVARLQTGYVKLHPTQYFRGYTLFVAKECVAELHELTPAVRARYLHEMAELAHAMFRAFRPRKLNYELLGNGCAHLHWHLVPRYATDAHPNGPVWEDLTFLRLLWTDAGLAGAAERDESRRALLAELRAAEVTIEREYAG